MLKVEGAIWNSPQSAVDNHHWCVHRQWQKWVPKFLQKINVYAHGSSCSTLVALSFCRLWASLSILLPQIIQLIFFFPSTTLFAATLPHPLPKWYEIAFTHLHLDIFHFRWGGFDPANWCINQLGIWQESQ